MQGGNAGRLEQGSKATALLQLVEPSVIGERFITLIAPRVNTFRRGRSLLFDARLTAIRLDTLLLLLYITSNGNRLLMRVMPTRKLALSNHRLVYNISI